MHIKYLDNDPINFHICISNPVNSLYNNIKTLGNIIKNHGTNLSSNFNISYSIQNIILNINNRKRTNHIDKLKKEQSLLQKQCKLQRENLHYLKSLCDIEKNKLLEMKKLSNITNQINNSSDIPKNNINTNEIINDVQIFNNSDFTINNITNTNNDLCNNDTINTSDDFSDNAEHNISKPNDYAHIPTIKNLNETPIKDSSNITIDEIINSNNDLYDSIVRTNILYSDGKISNNIEDQFEYVDINPEITKRIY